MNTTNNGGPASPVTDDVKFHMTLRDYFAAKAMQGFAADPDMGTRGADDIAALAYTWADEMLKAREAS